MRLIKNVLFLQPAGGALNFSPPLGLGYVATYAKHKLPEIRVKVADLSVEGIDLKSLMNAFRPDIIGISGVTPMAKDIRLLTEKIRSYDSTIPIVLGGPHVTGLRTEVFALPIDFAVVGEGEETFTELVRAIDNGRDLSAVDGLIYRGKNKEIVENRPRAFISNLDTIPRIDWSLFQMDKYAVSGTIISTRGCPYNCIFCSQPFGRSWRTHSAEYVFDTIKELVDKYNVRIIRFMDDNPLIKKERFIKICDLILNSGYCKKLILDLNHGTRIDIVDYELFTLLRKVGVKKIWFGLESANEEVLKGMRKNISLDNIAKSIAITHSLGFTVNAFITIGMPGDTYDRSMETMRYVRRNKVDLVSPAVATPFPGTDLYDWVEQNGRWINKDYETWCSSQSILFDTEDFTKEERIKALKKWLRFCALQRARLVLRAPKDSLIYAIKSPGIIKDSIRNMFGKPWYGDK